MDSNRIGEIFVVNCSQTTIYKYSSSGNLIKSFAIQKLGVSDRGFDWGGGLVVDSNSNVFLTDEKNSIILKINTASEITEIYAGRSGIPGQNNGSRLQATFNLPRGLAIDPQDNVYVADYSSGRIRKIDNMGQVSTLDSDICLPTALDLDSQGNLIIVSEFFCGSRIVKLTTNGIISTILNDSAESVGNVSWAVTGKLILGADSNIGIEVLPESGQKSDTYVVTDGKNGSVKFFDSNGKIIRTVGSSDVFGVNKYPNQSPIFNSPGAIFPLSDGNLLIADNATLRLVSDKGAVLSYMHLPFGCGANAMLWPDGTLFCSSGSYIQVRNPDGTTSRIGSESKGLIDGDSTQAKFECVGKLSFDGEKVLAIDSCNHAVRTIERIGDSKVYRVGTLVAGIALQRQDFTVSRRTATFSWPTEVATSPDGNVYIAEGGMDRLRKLDPKGEGSVSVIGGNFRSWPSGIVIDGTGRVFVMTERGYLYEIVNNSLVKIGGDGPGINEGQLSNSLFYMPKSMAIGTSGELLIADSGNHVIRKVSGLNLTPTQIYDIRDLTKLLAWMKVIQLGQPSSNNNSSSSSSLNRPSFSRVSFSGNIINIIVSIGTSSNNRPERVYLVSPKLGIYPASPKLGKISGNVASWSIPLDKTLSGTLIPLEIVAEKNGERSASLTGAYKAPVSTSQTKNTSVPSAPRNFQYRISGSSAIVTVSFETKKDASPTDVFLYSTALGIPKSKAIRGEIISNKGLIELPINASMVGKKLPVTVFLSNAKGASKPILGTISIPTPKKQTQPTSLPVPPKTPPKTTICTRANQTRAFEGDTCPPGWEKR
jgi:sugar lactone lactonase YvrE